VDASVLHDQLHVLSSIGEHAEIHGRITVDKQKVRQRVLLDNA